MTICLANPATCHAPRPAPERLRTAGMPAVKRLIALVPAVVILAVAVWWVRGSSNDRETSTIARDERSAILPMGAPSDFFAPQPAGDPILERRRPEISNVQVVDLDGDGLPDILVCDVIRNQVTWIRQFPRGT